MWRRWTGLPATHWRGLPEMFEGMKLTGAPLIKLTVMQGQARVSAGPRVELSTVLGSCVATCLYDPSVQLGGMNHFLLAEPDKSGGKVDEHYGVYLMEVLINEMLANGATKSGLRAHLYGGANLHAGMTKIGTANGTFARNFLERERIQIVRADLGGTQARRVDFRPAHGQVRCRLVEPTIVPNEQPLPRRATGDVELF